MKNADEPNQTSTAARQFAEFALAPGVFALLGVILGMSLVLAHPGHNSAGVEQIDLLAVSLAPKLNKEGSAPLGSDVVPASHSAAPKPLALLDPAAPVLAPPPLANGYRSPLQGESPMMRTWKMLALNVLLAGAVSAPPLLADPQAPAASPPAATAPANAPANGAADATALTKKIDDLQKTVDGLTKSFRSMDDELGKQFTRVGDDVVKMNLRLGKAQEDVEEMRKLVAELRKDLDSLKSRSQVSSGYSPMPAAPGAPALPATALGHVRLVNSYAEPVTVVVNAKSYPVMPGQTVFADLPAGTFTYEVLGVQPAQPRQLAANETFTVTVHPR